MSSTVLALIVAFISGGAGFLAIWQTARQRKAVENVGAKKIDAEAYGRAQIVYETSLKYLQGQLERLQRELERQQVRNAELEGQVSDLRAYVKDLLRTMVDAKLNPPLPPTTAKTILDD